MTISRSDHCTMATHHSATCGVCATPFPVLPEHRRDEVADAPAFIQDFGLDPAFVFFDPDLGPVCKTCRLRCLGAAAWLKTAKIEGCTQGA